jgi:hypothetical protein
VNPAAAEAAGPGRIVVLGSPGSGKSTFCHALAGGTGLPLVHLDDAYWGPGWNRTPADAWARTVQDLAAGEHWIIDGNFADTVPQRLARAEAVVVLDRHPAWCALALVRRSRRLRRAARTGRPPHEYLPAGLTAQDPPVRSLTALLRKAAGFRRRELRRMAPLLDAAGAPVLRCRSRRAAARVLRQLIDGAARPPAHAAPPTGAVLCACAHREDPAAGRPAAGDGAGRRALPAEERSIR